MTPSRELVEAIKAVLLAHFECGAMSKEHLTALRTLQTTPASDAQFDAACGIARAELAKEEA